MNVTAVEYSDVDETYAWDLVDSMDSFQRCMLFPGASVQSQSGSRISEAVGRTLSGLCPEVVAIPGWHDRCSLAALEWCKKHGIPAVVMSETTPWDSKRTGWKEFVKKRLINLFSAGLAGGHAHAEYLEQLGVPRERIFLGYDAVDNEYFASRGAEARGQRLKIRGQQGKRSLKLGAGSGERNGLPENYFLASARFVPKKNLALLIEAYARYRELTSQLPAPSSQHAAANSPLLAPWSLVILGDGPLKSDVCHLISDLRLAAHVHLPGFKQYQELPTYYALASAFIHPSTTEQWGLVVNEAMASGLPVLVSNRCGCAADLVQEGRNGFTFDPVNFEALAQLMLRISALNFPLTEFGSASREIISNWGPNRFATGLRAAVALALKDQGRCGQAADRLLLQFILHGSRFLPVWQEGAVFPTKKSVTA